MVHIQVKKGLDIPIGGKPGPLAKVEQAPQLTTKVALDLTPFQDLKLRLLVKPGDSVKLGEPLVQDKTFEARSFLSPASGTVLSVDRGEKRVLQKIVIEVAAKEEPLQIISPTTPSSASKEAILEAFSKGGIFTKITSRPFGNLANPTKTPRCIFVRAIESAPFTPPAEYQVAGREKEFQAGLDALAKLTDGKVHLVYRQDTPLTAFSKASNVEKHTVAGPHPAGNASLHIQKIDPIRGVDDNVWVLNALDCVCIGHLLLTGKACVERIVSIAGPGIIEGRTGYIKGREGMAIEPLLANRLQKGRIRLISGDPLTGHKIEPDGFLGYQSTVLAAISENTEREFLHFFRLGGNKYSFSRAYLSGHYDNENAVYPFTTSQHGEHRPFIDASLYDKVMPLDVPTMHLVKAVMAEDFDLAETYGLLEVVGEDFALPTFVCPSKMEMTEIISHGLKRHAKDVQQ